MDEWWADEIFIGEYSDESSLDLDDEDYIKNSTSLTRQFIVIPSESDGNWLFNTLKQCVFFGMQSSSFDIWTEIWKYIEKKKEAYQSFYEGNIENLLLNMRRDGYWGTNFELLDFSDLMRININIYILH